MNDAPHPDDPFAFPAALARQLHRAAIAAVVVLDDEAHAVPLAEALWAGGVTAVELTLRTPAALPALSQMRRAVPELIIAAGTVIERAQVSRCLDAGADLALAPGCNPSVVRAAQQAGLPFVPGVCTPTEIELAVQAGCRLLKFFPAQSLGGLSYLRTIHAPFDHLGLRYLPLGGIQLETAGHYLTDPIVQCVGGSWIAPRELIAAGQWQQIQRQARRATELVQSLQRETGS